MVMRRMAMTVSRWILLSIFCGGINFYAMISDWTTGDLWKRGFGFISLVVLILALWNPKLVIKE